MIFEYPLNKVWIRTTNRIFYYQHKHIHDDRCEDNWTKDNHLNISPCSEPIIQKKKRKKEEDTVQPANNVPLIYHQDHSCKHLLWTVNRILYLPHLGDRIWGLRISKRRPSWTKLSEKMFCGVLTLTNSVCSCSTSVYDSKRPIKLQARSSATPRFQCSNSSPDMHLTSGKFITLSPVSFELFFFFFFLNFISWANSEQWWPDGWWLMGPDCSIVWK
jgi:hypothetical protein